MQWAHKTVKNTNNNKHIYNETRSKSLITLLNHMNVSVGYDTFHRYIIAMCEQIMDAEKEDSMYSPPAINGCKFIQFAIDNADWHEKNTWRVHLSRLDHQFIWLRTERQDPKQFILRCIYKVMRHNLVHFSMICDVIKNYDDILAFRYNYHMQLMISINKTPNFAILHEV